MIPEMLKTCLDAKARCSQSADLVSSSSRLYKASSKHNSLWHDEILHRESDRTTSRTIAAPILLVGGRGYVWTND